MRQTRRMLWFLGVIAAVLIGIYAAVVYFTSGAASGDSLRLSVYFLNSAANKLEPEKQVIPNGTNKEIAGAALQLLYDGPKNKNLAKTMREDILPVEAKVAENETDNNYIFVVEFPDTYRQMNSVEELFFRASLVWTMTDLDFIDGVHIYVDGEELLNSAGQPLGILNRNNVSIDPQILPAKSETQTLTLYFTDAQSQYLIPEERSVIVNPDRPLERYILEQLIAGTNVQGHIQLIPQETKILETKKVDNICYVNFSGEFVSRHAGGAAMEKLTIYSIVNSLTELPDVKKVQILVEGEKLATYKGSLALDNPLERDADLIE